MNINQPINLSFTDIADSKNYRVITSDDGVNWKDVESS